MQKRATGKGRKRASAVLKSPDMVVAVYCLVGLRGGKKDSLFCEIL